MSIVTISSEYGVVIPNEMRESLGLSPGQEMLVVQQAGRIELVPVVSVKQSRGFLKGIDSTVLREDPRT